MTPSNCGKLTQLLLPLAIAGVASMASADSGEFTLEEIVVTAQKRTQSLQDVPIAIDAFSENAVKERGIDSAEDLAVHTPSLQYGEAVGSAQLSIRGVGFGIVTGAGENSVAVHSDGIYIANPGAVAMLQSGASSIEVLKGPQGTLWGRNATAGVINFVTAAPTEELSGSIKLGYGSYDAKVASATISVPVNDSIRTRLAITSSERDGYISNPVAGDTGGDELLDVRFSADIDVSDSVSAKIRAFHATYDAVGPVWDHNDDRILDNGFLPALGFNFEGTYDTDPFRSLANSYPSLEDELTGGSVRIDWDINDDISLASITGYVDYERDAPDTDMDGTNLQYVSVSRGGTDKTLSQEFDLSGSHGKLDWLVGAFFMKQDVTNVTPNADLSGAAPVVPLDPAMSMWLGTINIEIDFEEEIESTALFADGTYTLTDTLRAFAGIRYMEEERDATLHFYQHLGIFDSPSLDNRLTTQTIVACENQRQQQDVDETTGRLGLQWDLSDEVMTYAQISTGYKSGGNSTSACNDDFEAENLDAIEMGFKSTLLDGQLRLSGAVYAYDYTNLQVEEVIRSSARVNNADAEILGAELDALYRVNQNIELNVGLSLLDTEYTQFENVDLINDASGTSQDLSGNPLLRSPEWTLVLGGQYTLPLSSGGEIVFRADVNIRDAYQLREFDHPLDEQDASTVANIRVSYTSADEHWHVVAWGKNITDEEVMISMLNANSTSGANVLTGLPEPLNTGWSGSVYAPPATFGASVEYMF
ncbi:TonB-dependent receptor [Pseudomaricurvus alkylphenolicus]|uniref:TonB-dependent receptor n=1 Tax=Pseudomaricurvus alkylphenolicus TaxID=1306991 RepID=UPI0014235027|nr:TonB-dependent receptor [Pseudomaricurvus alkylphenolicus]NIB38852.1 TonB-dependent receptor [Pseudomaricurvus alkylphenolicus]